MCVYGYFHLQFSLYAVKCVNLNYTFSLSFDNANTTGYISLKGITTVKS